MQTSHLRTLLAIRDTGSFSAAADVVSLSHSAISVQMKQLEEQLGAPLFVKGRRPALLTPLGEEVAEKAQAIVAQLDALKALGGADDVAGRVTLGFVPTTLQTLLPVVLERLRADFPDLRVSVRSGLSRQLAKLVAEGDVDFAFLSSPIEHNPQLRLLEIGQEPLMLVTSKKTPKGRVADLLRQNPYIAFNRNTWLGAQIARHLLQTGYLGEPDIELDSIDAIEHLVAQGFGVSVVPQRLMAAPLEETLQSYALSQPAPVRRMMLATPRHCRRQTLRECLSNIAAG